MGQNTIVSKMNGYLHAVASELAAWLGRLLPKTSEDWWEECVMEKISFNQRETATKRGFTKLEDFDLAALLRITDKTWYIMRDVAYLPAKERECIRDMMRVRNNWAHVSASLPGKDAIVEDLETLHQFFRQMQCERVLLDEIEHLIEDVKSPQFVEEPEAESFEETTEAEPVSVNEDDIKEKSLVYLIGDPSVHGIVMDIADLDGTKKYQVFVNGEFKTFYSGQIALFEEKETFQWSDIRTFRSHMTAYQINHPSTNDLYSLNSARIDFVPYQFRPALKLIHADEPRILIADSVGVGKTIEAGLIIKELQARSELERILIICPKPLVAERKWELEMKRFDEEFAPVDGAELRQILSDTDRDGEWPVRYNKLIIPYSILDDRTYNGVTNKKKKSYGLRSLDPPPHFDLVIVDEAHHIRNGSMEMEKAFAYKCVKYFCDHADAVVMLTATPLQTSDDDLFTLLNVLRPDIVIDKTTFDMMSRPNEHISKCASAIRRAAEGWQAEAVAHLNGVLTTQWGENVISANPAYSAMLKTLHQREISREERVKLISDAESLHSFNSMLNRTRRRDIQDFCVRKPYTLAVDFTPKQQELHNELLRFEECALLELHGSARAIPFMISTLKRQAASCIFGLAPHIRELINKRFQQMTEDPDFDVDNMPLDGFDAASFAGLAKTLLDMADNLPEDDPKFDQMMEAVREKQKLDNNKIILFSTFRFTLRYVKEKLEKEGIRVAQVDGSVKDATRQELRGRFELPKSDPDAIDMLLFTEVGSEGLDYQFCNMMINYDLPWNPMRIEQRIGRIDRRGQQSEVVSIYNMITNDTVDADIYFRCLMRIGIFENSIGECDEILGDIAAKIDGIVVDAHLTDAERKQKLEQMADNEVRKMQELEKLEEEEREFFGFDLSEYTTSQEIHRAENPWMSQKCIQIMIEQYLNERLGIGSYILGEGDTKQLRLSAGARADLREDYRKLPSGRNAVRLSWDYFLKGNVPMHAITFDSETAEKQRDAFFITAMHPLTRQAAAYYASNETSYIRVNYATEDMPAGEYKFSVYAWSYHGVNPHFRLVVVCENDAITAELPDVLQEAQTGMSKGSIKKEEWDILESKQVKLWMDEKAGVLKDAESSAKYKLESITNNFNNRKRALERKIAEAANESIQRMYKSELESASEAYEVKVAGIQKTVSQTDIHSTLIANGILNVTR